MEMKEIDGKEKILHTIRLDEYMSVNLLIPKELSVLDLKALMWKANKMFNLAEVPMSDKTIDGRKKYGWWKPEEEEKLKSLLGTMPVPEIAREMGMKPSRIYSKIKKDKLSFVKKRVNKPTTTPTEEKPRKLKSYSKEFKEEAIKKWDSNNAEIRNRLANEMGLKRHQVSKLVWAWKQALNK